MATPETPGIFAQKANVNRKMCFMTEFINYSDKQALSCQITVLPDQPQQKKILEDGHFFLGLLREEIIRA